MGVFSKSHNPETTLKRNSFDLSFQNNVTFNIGDLPVVFCKETLPGDTFTIDTAFGLRFMPTLFPIQNRMRADVHFFYVRSRNLYNEYKEWYTHNEVKKPFPTLGPAMTTDADSLKVGGIFDYFNIPTVWSYRADRILFDYTAAIRVVTPQSVNSWDTRWTVQLPDGSVRPLSDYSKKTLIEPGSVINSLGLQNSAFVTSSNPGSLSLPEFEFRVLYNTTKGVIPMPSYAFKDSYVILNNFIDNDLPSGTMIMPIIFSVYDGFSSIGLEWCGPAVSFESLNQKIYYNFNKDSDRIHPYAVTYYGLLIQSPTTDSTEYNPNDPKIPVYARSSGQVDISNFPTDSSRNPYINKIPLSALPFRAYESIYNSFFRDERNNPRIVDGKPVYDKYIPTDEGGPDSNIYRIHRRNWEQDFLTTALPNPQQGNAPLVGISASGVISIQDEDTGTVYQAQAITADDADTIVGAKFLKTNEDSTPIPGHVARALVDYASSGISINDFRNVNALQRYLENNLRRGLKYRDMIESRWGVTPSYATLDMPEFIGGVTEMVNPVQVNQTSQDTSSSPLGSFAGQLYASGRSKHTIRHYCDEPGYIIGVLSVVPTPVYTQVLPKMFTKIDPLDFFNPEFGHIGLQPIPIREVAPLQQMYVDSQALMTTFGYQRAWYDYLSSIDEAHGQFRSTLRDFVMYRTYDEVPQLSTDFLLVNHDDVDNVFSVQTDSEGNSVDKIMGALFFDVKANRPIPKYGVPRLE